MVILHYTENINPSFVWKFYTTQYFTVKRAYYEFLLQFLNISQTLNRTYVINHQKLQRILDWNPKDLYCYLTIADSYKHTHTIVYMCEFTSGLVSATCGRGSATHFSDRTNLGIIQKCRSIILVERDFWEELETYDIFHKRTLKSRFKQNFNIKNSILWVKLFQCFFRSFSFTISIWILMKFFFQYFCYITYRWS